MEEISSNPHAISGDSALLRVQDNGGRHGRTIFGKSIYFISLRVPPSYAGLTFAFVREIVLLKKKTKIHGKVYVRKRAKLQLFTLASTLYTHSISFQAIKLWLYFIWILDYTETH